MRKSATRPLCGLALGLLALSLSVDPAAAQANMAPVNDLPNPCKWTYGHLRDGPDAAHEHRR